MTGSGATAEVRASVDVRPARSQVFLVASAIVAGISVVCGASLFALGMATGWLFLIFAALVLGGGFSAWKKSQSDSDLEEAHPTNITLPDGMKLSTDSRTLRSPEGIDGLAKLLHELLCRRPLPDPDGLVDSNAQIILDSKGEAQSLVNKINNDTQATTDSLIDMLGLSDKTSYVTQEPVYPTDNSPADNILHGLNITDSHQNSN